MAAAMRQPAVQPVAKCRSVGHAYVQPATRLDHTSHLSKGAAQVVEMFQAMVGDDRIEAMLWKGELGGVGLNEVGYGRAGELQVDTHDTTCPSVAKTASAAAQVQNPGSGR